MNHRIRIRFSFIQSIEYGCRMPGVSKISRVSKQPVLFPGFIHFTSFLRFAISPLLHFAISPLLHFSTSPLLSHNPRESHKCHGEESRGDQGDRGTLHAFRHVGQFQLLAYSCKDDQGQSEP